MIQQGNTNCHLIPWKKAYLYALGWLVGTCMLAVIPPMAIEFLDIDMSEPLPVILLITSYIMLFAAVIFILRMTHHSWRVSIAYIAELIIASIILGFIGLIAFVSLMQGLGTVF